MIIALALLLTAFVMGPAFQTAYENGIEPLIAEEIEVDEAFARASDPFRTFMLAQVSEKDLALFIDMTGIGASAEPSSRAE